MISQRFPDNPRAAVEGDGELIDQVLAALADPTRRRVVEMLADGSALTVSQIASRFEISRQAVTKHLAILAQGGLLTFERRGRERLNRLQPYSLQALADWTKQYSVFWDDRLAALKQMVEKEETP